MFFYPGNVLNGDNRPRHCTSQLRECYNIVCALSLHIHTRTTNSAAPATIYQNTKHEKHKPVTPQHSNKCTNHTKQKSEIDDSLQQTVSDK